MICRTRKEKPSGTGDLPQGGAPVPGTSRSSLLSRILKILTPKLQQIGGGDLPPICCNLWKSKFYKYLDRGLLSAARKRGTTLPGNLERASIWMNIVEREKGELLEARGPVTLPPRVGCTGPLEPPGALLSRILIGL